MTQILWRVPVLSLSLAMLGSYVFSRATGHWPGTTPSPEETAVSEVDDSLMLSGSKSAGVDMGLEPELNHEEIVTKQVTQAELEALLMEGSKSAIVFRGDPTTPITLAAPSSTTRPLTPREQLAELEVDLKAVERMKRRFPSDATSALHEQLRVQYSQLADQLRVDENFELTQPSFDTELMSGSKSPKVTLFNGEPKLSKVPGPPAQTPSQPQRNQP